MKQEKIVLKTEVTCYADDSALSAEHRALIAKAKEASKRAYAPYSEFRVGAALELDSGRIVLGNNQENAAYPAGICAERVAVFAASANFPNAHIKAIAVYAESDQVALKSPVTPCGVCRQVLLEYEKKQSQQILLFMVSPSGEIYRVESTRHLLPLAFDEEKLKGNE